MRAERLVLILGLACGPALAQLPPVLSAPVTSLVPQRPGGLSALAESEAGNATQGAAPSLGALGIPIPAGAPTPGMQGRGWSITPSIAAQVLGTDNAGLTATGRRSEFITTITPGLLTTIDTARLQGIVNYTPNVQIFARDTGQTRINQRYNAQLLATLVADALFLDLRAAAAVQAAGGGFGQPGIGGQTIVNRANQVQTQTIQLSPYFVHRFGDLATMQVGYAFQSVRQQLGGNATGALTPQGDRFFTNQDFIAHEGYAVARTGPDFGRFAMEGRIVSTDYDGSGVLRGASRRSAVVETRYALTRQFALLAEAGYETQRYAGTTPFRLNGAVWGLGARLTLSDESAITVKYIHRGGFSSPVLDAVISLGGRTRVFANYSERLTTGAQRAVDLLSTTTLDALGNPVDLATGAPVAQPFADSFLGAQSSLQRIRRAAVSINQSWPRDIITLTLSHERRQPVTAAPGTIAFLQRGNSITLSWVHLLTASTTAFAQFQYGRFDTAGSGTSDVISANATLSTQLTPGLTAFAQYVLTNRGSDGLPARAMQNAVIIGLRQSF
jgi:uncharacterized protein (PEP-CTERM system associated)